MELRQLRYFVAVAETGNISRAAQRIFLTQPALSRQIKALEEDIGQCLLSRQANSVRLTPAGETMLVEARKLLHDADQALARVKAVGDGVRLRIGYAPTLAAGLLSPAVETFTQAHPGARVELFDLSTAEMLAGIESGELDAALSVKDAGSARGLKWTTLVRSPWRVALPRTHRLARESRVRPADLSGERLVVLRQRDYPEYWVFLTGWFRRHHLQPRIAGEHDGVESLMTAVESGLGLAMVITHTAARFPTRAVFKALVSPPAPICIAAGYRADRADEKPLAVFVEELRRNADLAADSDPELPPERVE